MAFIGEPVGQTTFVQDKVCQWTTDVQSFSKIAEKQPQAAFVALTKSLQCEWQFCNVLSLIVAVFLRLWMKFWLLLSCQLFLTVKYVTLHECLLFFLPVCFGGFGVFCLHCTAEFCFSTSREATQVIIQALHGSRFFEVDRHERRLFFVLTKIL